MSAPLLLDTCAAIWIANGQAIEQQARLEMTEAIRSGSTVYVSAITAWEIGLLVSRGRLNLLLRPDIWFERLLQAPGVQLAELSYSVLIASSFLPGKPPRDPADRMIAATARECGYRLMTRDRPLLDYGDQGHVQVISC
ncbi:MAG: type II toxin-antitoxin system VapC family toxin [Pseudorhodoplanes sp.]|nr:type II toxin-antitoxin system VapC family toxin [Pseudorhodoplanes sp.]